MWAVPEAACEDGSTCYTGRADATGGYCQASVVPMPDAQAPTPAPVGQGARVLPMNQTCQWWVLVILLH